MSQTDDKEKPARDPDGKLARGVPNNGNGGGRKRKRLTSDVEDYLIDALNIQGARMLVQCMTSATKLCGADCVEHPDWKERRGAFETIRDTVLGKPTMVVTGEDGAPVIGNLGVELVDALQKLADKKP